MGPTLEVHDLDFPSNLTNLQRIQNGCFTYAQNCVQSGGDSNLGADQKDCGFRDENGEGYRMGKVIEECFRLPLDSNISRH